jgi:hypothetical protein
MIRRVSGLALGMALMTSTAFAVDTDVPSKPWAGPNCIKYTIGNTVYAFNTSDVSSNADGRKTAVNDAFLLAYPVQVSVASENGFSATLDHGGSMVKTPWQVTPATP